MKPQVRQALHGCLMVLVVGCSRTADIVDEPDVVTLMRPTGRQIPDGGIPTVVDSGVASDAFLSCSERPVGGCNGPVDFPCGVTDWIPMVATACQQPIGCRARGWLRVELGQDGCTSEIGLEEPNQPFLSCVVETLGGFRCPCGATQVTYFVGLEDCSDGAVINPP